MATAPQDRGARAAAISSSEILQEAISATQDWAQSTFRASTDRDEAWNARLRMQAVEEFVAYMMAVIQMGRAATEKLIVERDKMSQRKRDRDSVVDYLDNAREARADFLRKQQEREKKVAKQ